MAEGPDERVHGLPQAGSAGWRTGAEMATTLRNLRRREARQREGAELTYRQLAAKAGWSHAVVADYLAQMPISRVGTVEDIAEAIAYLCGPGSTWVTGPVLGVDGGHTLRRGPDVEHWARAPHGDAAIDLT